MTSHRKKNRFKIRSLYVWHRYVGLFVALLAILLAITGFMVNRTESLKLDTTFIDSERLLDWYGITPPDDILAFATGNVVISQIGEHIFLNNQSINGKYKKLVGALETQEMIIIAVSGELVLLAKNGQLLERLNDTHGVPAGMRKIGLGQEDSIVIIAAHGYYSTDQNFVDWNESKNKVNANWSRPADLPDELHKQLVKIYRGKGLTMERVLLDLHSGRILGKWGQYIMDIAAFLIIFLAASGIWLWINILYKRQSHKRRNN